MKGDGDGDDDDGDDQGRGGHHHHRSRLELASQRMKQLQPVRLHLPRHPAPRPALREASTRARTFLRLTS